MSRGPKATQLSGKGPVGALSLIEHKGWMPFLVQTCGRFPGR